MHTIWLAGRRTSVRLHRLERAALDRLCRVEGLTLSEFCEQAVATHGLRNRSASLRLALLTYLLRRADGFVDLAVDGLVGLTAGRQDEEQQERQGEEGEGG
ncbi:MAG: ribbon-helix-helix domain-containing protein [Alphaproteobacteria bacterium]|nr:ribbon-helix-helix domain-containing protein [Alphaproteobacteria bacterium]